MAVEGYLQPFDSIGITPPRGRAGHSVPLPRLLTGGSFKSSAPPGAVSGGQLQPPEGIQVWEIMCSIIEKCTVKLWLHVLRPGSCRATVEKDSVLFDSWFHGNSLYTMSCKHTPPHPYLLCYLPFLSPHLYCSES